MNTEKIDPKHMWVDSGRTLPRNSTVAGDAASTGIEDKKTILIVEDDFDLSRILTYRFAQAGYTVMAFSDGHEALQWVAGGTPSVAILDVLLPGMDGYEICNALRNHARSDLRELPIIMVTALSDDEKKRQGYRTGATMYFRKPVYTGRLIRHVEALLGTEIYPWNLPDLD